MRLRLQVNGGEREAEAREHESLLTVLRERLGLWGSKNACEQGECGSCSVLMDGQLVCACLAPGAAEVATSEPSRTSRTASGASGAARVVDAGAVQCGFCTPGFIVATAALLRDNPEPSDAEIREALSGNICRCTGYGKILEAVQRSAAKGYGA